MSTNNRRVCWTILAVLPVIAGCTTLDFDLANFGQEPDQTARVSNVQCVWQTGEGVGLDGLPTRGFAGQVLFFARGQAEPVSIQGDVRVYVFDDQGTLEEQARPIHEFNFPAEVWNTYLQQTNLGPAYHVFIPYTRKGGMAANCALRIRMTNESGAAVYSQLASVTLAGRRAAQPTAVISTPAADPLATAAVDSPVQQAAILRARSELGLPDQSGQLRRLHQAAQSAVQTADYSEEDETGVTATADYEVEEPISRRYRMSGGDRTP